VLYQIDCNIQIVLSEGSNEFTLFKYNFCVYGNIVAFMIQRFYAERISAVLTFVLEK
jgi:hypothetical protein